MQADLEAIDQLRKDHEFGKLEALASRLLKTLPVSRIGVSRSKFEETRAVVASLQASRAFALLKLGRLPDAMAEAKNAVVTSPDDMSLQLLLAHVHYVCGDVSACKMLCLSLMEATSASDDSDISGTSPEESSEMRRRAKLLLNRCAVDETYATDADDACVLERPGFDDDADFYAMWDVVSANGVSSCLDLKVEDVAARFTAHLETSKLRETDYGGGCNARLLRDAGTVLALTLADLVHRCKAQGGPACCPRKIGRLVDEYASVVATSLVCACSAASSVRSEVALHEAVSVMLRDSTIRRRCFVNDNVAEVLTNKVNMLSHKMFVAAKGRQSRNCSAIDMYQGAEQFLIQNGFRRPSRALSTELADYVTTLYCCDDHTGGSMTLSVAVCLFPLAAALFQQRSGDIVHSFMSQQTRRRNPPSSERQPDGDGQVNSDGEGLTPDIGHAETPSTSAVGKFPLLFDRDHGISQFAACAAPLVSHVRQRRNIAESKRFTQELVQSFCPREVHAALMQSIDTTVSPSPPPKYMVDWDN